MLFCFSGPKWLRYTIADRETNKDYSFPGGGIHTDDEDKQNPLAKHSRNC